MATSFLFFFISIAAAGAAQLPGAAFPATAAAEVLKQQQQQQQQQQAQQLDLFSSGLARRLQPSQGRSLLRSREEAGKDLLYFVANGKIPRARRALERGADPNFQNEDGFSPLKGAIASDNADMVRLLVEFGANIYDLVLDQNTGIKTDALHLAAVFGSTKAMAALLEAGAPIDKLDAEGVAALYAAVTENQIGAATFLLDEGAMVDITYRKADTPLVAAVARQYLELVKLLISRGADVERLNTAGIPPVIVAILVGSPEIVLQLILAGADPNGMGNGQGSPIGYAVLLGQRSIMDILIKSGADMSVLIFGKSLKEGLCGCTAISDLQSSCNFIACRDREGMLALLE